MPAEHGWHTPDSTAGDEICRPLFLPANEEILAIVGGALSELTKVWNYEQVGTLTPQETSEYMTNLIARWYAEQCGGSVGESVPFWESDDGSDASNDDPPETWYDEVSWFIITAFLATVVTPTAAVEYVTALRTLHLAFKRGGFGAIIDVFIDDVLVGSIDTYSAGTPVLEWIYDTGDDDPHTIRLVHSGTANPAASADPVLGGYRMDVIRKNIRFPLPNFSFLTRYDPVSGDVQSSIDGGDTWQDAPQADPRNVNQLLPPAGGDVRCNSAERMTNALQEVSNAIADALAGGALAADLGSIVLAWLALFAGFALLVALAAALAAAVISAGSAAISDAYNTMPWGPIKCKLLNLMSADGWLNDDAYNSFVNNYVPTLTAEQQTLLNLSLLIAGRGGLNNFASARTDTGSCSSCRIDNFFDFTDQSYDANFYRFTLSGREYTNPFTWVAGQGLVGAAPGFGLAMLVTNVRLDQVLNMRLCGNHTGGTAEFSYWIRSFLTHASVRAGYNTNIPPGAWTIDVVLSPFFTTDPAEFAIGIRAATGTPISNVRLRSAHFFADTAAPANPAYPCV